jgi:hypothetical protein
MNKKMILLPVLALPVLLSSYKIGGDCKPYFPVKEGVTFTVKTYMGDKLYGSTTSTVKSVTNSGDTLIVGVNCSNYDAKGNHRLTSNNYIICTGGVTYMDMSSITGSSQQPLSKGNFSVQGDILDIPSNPTPGQKLKEGRTTISSGTSPSGGEVSYDITDRKVDAMESITTPAGTFNCVRISYRITIETIVPVRQDRIEWYAVNVGLVRTESRDLGRKLKGYSVLESITGN